MKNVIYTIYLLGKKENFKLKGNRGKCDDNTLIIPQVSTKKDKTDPMPYFHEFEDIFKYCTKIPNTENEYRGFYTELIEKDLADEDGKKTKRLIEYNYKVWFKVLED